MAFPLLQRFLRRQSPTTLISFTRHNSRYQTISPYLLTHRSQSIDFGLKSLLPQHSTPTDDDSAKAEIKYDYVYPSFPYGLVVNPVFQKIVTEAEAEARKMWADSTKKKRKKKMNKHKYKKLRKLMSIVIKLLAKTSTTS